TIVGTEPAFFSTINLTIANGRALQPIDETEAAGVCVIGDEIRKTLFTYEDPIGKTLTVTAPGSSPAPFEVVGVLAPVVTAGTPAKGTSERNLNTDIFIPLSVADLRYGDFL